MADKYTTELYCFFGGLGVGLAVAILFAPDSGIGTRDRIRSKAYEARDLVSAKADEGREYLKRQGARLVDQTHEFVDRGKRVVANGSSTSKRKGSRVRWRRERLRIAQQ
jgi:gas vesicle protein